MRVLIFNIILLLIGQTSSAQCCIMPKNRVLCDTLNSELERQYCWLNLFFKNNYKIGPDIFKEYRNYKTGKDSLYLDFEHTAWGSNDFEYYKGGIAGRWQAGKTLPPLKDTLQLKWSAISKLSPSKIALLSPAEKLDIYIGNKDFLITKTEMLKRGLLTPNTSKNDGFCNGMRAAGALLPEPIKSITVNSKEGISVTFFPADLKALAGASYFHLYSDTSYGQVGCPINHSDTCSPHPGVFDMALRLALGHYQTPFFIDTARTNFLLNQTIIGYSRRIKGQASSINSNGEEARSIDIELSIYCLKSLPMSATNKPTKKIISDKSSIHKYPNWFRTYKYSYKLFTDKNGYVTGGYWTSRMPDFIWFAFGEGGDNRQPKSDDNANPNLPTTIIKQLVLQASR